MALRPPEQPERSPQTERRQEVATGFFVSGGGGGLGGGKPQPFFPFPMLRSLLFTRKHEMLDHFHDRIRQFWVLCCPDQHVQAVYGDGVVGQAVPGFGLLYGSQ